MLAVPEGTVASWLSRGRAALRRELDPFAIFFERASGLTARRPAGDVVGTFYLPNGENLWIIAADVATLAENASRYEGTRTRLGQVPGGADVGSRVFVFGDRPDGARVIIDLYSGAKTNERE